AARRQQAVARGEISLVYTAPERLRQPQFVRALRDRGVSLLVVDEAHCVSLWGHDFRPDYLFIRRVREDLGSPAVLALTATAPPTMQDDIERQLGTPLVRVNLGTYRPNLRFSVLRVQSEVARRNRIITLLSEETGPTIVYVDRRKKAEELSRQLRDAGVPAVGYHAGLDRARRNAVQDEFMQNRARVIVATIAFGMGVDNPDVRLVLHASLPRSLEAYYQEAGRAGRDGLIARCILVHTGFDLELLRRHAEEDRLRRNELLRLYDLLADQLEQGLGGVTLEELVTPTGMDLTRLRVAIGALEQMGILERGYDVPFSVWVGVPALTGEGPGRGRQTPALTQALTQLGVPPGQAGIVPAAPLAGALQTPVDRLEEVLRELSVAGRIRFRVQKRFPGLRLLGARQEVGRRLNALLATQEDQDEHRIQGLIRYLDQPGCRQATISDYFGRPLEQACRRCDRCEETRVVADRSRRGYPVDAGPDRRGLELGGREQVVFERLQGWRNQKARAEGIPVQAVLPNRCLGAIARREPRTLPALAEISGMGRVRVRQYGEEILNLLRLT
ncbi:MAG: ATP-dependent DNA helicase RecQ, partial [Armatimonadetes bacterium]|nr:ATP-dependent DNA helicase RecQ [Armatimonadota bacterium]